MNFEQVVGTSAALKQVLKLVETVALSDSTVLLLGETGTGKELIARAVHDHSRRKDRTFVKLNCAAIPTGLLESELFGNEKGAFTGAISQKIGRMELVDQGTLLLDEVGDIPTEIQPKLLRALQEREFERLGSTHTRKVNVRLIAATNRDLEKMVAAREFRSDLYYRLNVFPIRIPPLRERREDIPLLVTEAWSGAHCGRDRQPYGPFRRQDSQNETNCSATDLAPDPHRGRRRFAFGRFHRGQDCNIALGSGNQPRSKRADGFTSEDAHPALGDHHQDAPLRPSVSITGSSRTPEVASFELLQRRIDIRGLPSFVAAKAVLDKC